MSSRVNGVVTAGLWVLVALLAVRFAFFVSEAATQESNGYSAYYTAARVVTSDADVSRLYDDAWFQTQIATHGPDIADIFHPNPPTAALLLAPIASLDYTTARLIWTIFNFVCLGFAMCLLVRATDLRGQWIPAIAALTLGFQPVYSNFNQGQAYTLLLALIVLAWLGYRNSNPRLLGITLGGMLVLKTAGFLLWPLLFAQRNWRALAWAGGTICISVLVTLPWLGVDAWRRYLEHLLALDSRSELAVTAYQSQAGLIRQLFITDPRWNPAPLLDAPMFGNWLLWASVVAMAGASLVAAIVTAHRDLGFAVVITVMIILSPLSLDYHYTLLLAPIAILIGWMRTQATPWPAALLVIAVLLIAADLPYQSPRLSDGMWVLFAYPKFYGGCILWGLALWACRCEMVTAAAPMNVKMAYR